jgi:hypothetical protein
MRLRPIDEIKDARPIAVEQDPRFQRTLTVLDHTGKVIGYIDTKQARRVADWLLSLDLGPELLEALKLARIYVAKSLSYKVKADLEVIDAALAKARGE